MAVRYLKRYRMLLDTRQRALSRAVLPEEFSWVAWHPSLLTKHAAVKHDCFRQELDAHIFPALASREGCRKLLADITRHRGFLPGATWMIRIAAQEFTEETMCGMVQGIRSDTQHGAIQNLGVVTEFRGLGLGKALLLKSLAGFRQEGLTRIYLEVTAANEAAVDLYRSIGFEIVSTRYREFTVAEQLATDQRFSIEPAGV